MVSDLGMIVALLALLLSISAGTYIILSKCFPDFGVTGGVQAEDHNHKSLSSVPDHNDLARDNSTSRHKTMLSSEVPDNQEQTFSNIPTHDYSAEPLLITPGPEGAKENCGLTNNTNHDAEENDADQRHDHDHHYNSLQKATQSDKCISSNGGLHHSNGQKNGMVDKLRQPKDPILVHPDEVLQQVPMRISSKFSDKSPIKTTQLDITTQRNSKRRAQKISHILIVNGLLETTL